MTVDAYIVGTWTDEDIKKRLDELPRMRSLVLYGGGISDDAAEMLSCCQNLRELHLVDTCITDRGMASIGKLKALDWLVIDKANVTDRGLSCLGDLQRLDGLQVLETSVGDDGFSVLRRYPGLTYLETSGQHIRNKAISLIAQLPTLLSLRISSPTAENRDFLNLAFSKSIRTLSYDLPRVTQDAVMELRSYLRECDIERFVFSRPHDKVLYLASFCMEMYEQQEFHLARSAADDMMKWLPFNPAAHGARAFINFKMGNYFDFKKDMESARNHATVFGDYEVQRMAEYFLSLELDTIKNIIQHERPEQLVIERLRAASENPTQKPAPVRAIEPRDVFLSRQLLLEAGLVLQPRPEMLLLKKLREKTQSDIIKVPWQW